MLNLLRALIMPHRSVYVDLKGREYALEGLAPEEQQIVVELQERAQNSSDWNDFDNWWLGRVAAFYDARGVSRRESRQTIIYRIGQDLSSRLAIAAGMARPPDYRD